MASRETPAAARALEVYLQLGPERTLPRLAESLGYRPASTSLLSRWSVKYGWPGLAIEHDRQSIRDSLGASAVHRDRARVDLAAAASEAVATALTILRDTSTLPVFDRHGNPLKDSNDNPITRPVVAASTRLQAAQWILATIGVAPVKRLELEVQKQPTLEDQADAIADCATTDQIRQLRALIGEMGGEK